MLIGQGLIHLSSEIIPPAVDGNKKGDPQREGGGVECACAL